MNNSVSQLESLVKELHSKLGYIVRAEERKMSGIENISMKIIVFSVITLIVIFLLVLL